MIPNLPEVLGAQLKSVGPLSSPLCSILVFTLLLFYYFSSLNIFYSLLAWALISGILRQDKYLQRKKQTVRGQNHTHLVNLRILCKLYIYLSFSKNTVEQKTKKKVDFSKQVEYQLYSHCIPSNGHIQVSRTCLHFPQAGQLPAHCSHGHGQNTGFFLTSQMLLKDFFGKRGRRGKVVIKPSARFFLLCLQGMISLLAV